VSYFSSLKQGEATFAGRKRTHADEAPPSSSRRIHPAV
jgi:hypothetical protein